MNMLKLVMMIIIAVASLALIVPLFTDSAGLLPAWMTVAPYPLVFLILWVLIVIGSFVMLIR
jgi:hypothetical protein